MQKTQLQDDLRIAEQSAAHLKAEELSLREELNAQIRILSELEKRFERQVADSHKEMETLQMKLVQSQKTSGQLCGVSSDNEPNIDAQLVEAHKTVNLLTAEKIQLLEAYELLESDTGRLIDDAIRGHRDQVDVLNGQLQVGLLRVCQASCLNTRVLRNYYIFMYQRLQCHNLKPMQAIAWV